MSNFFLTIQKSPVLLQQLPNGEICGLDWERPGCTGNNCATWASKSYPGNHSQCESNYCKCKKTKYGDVCECSTPYFESTGSICPEGTSISSVVECVAAANALNDRFELSL